MTEISSARIDRWLWAVRICKTRSLASDMCKRQRVFIDGQLTKPSRLVRVGQTVGIKKDGITWEYRVLQCIVNRVGAKIAAECKEDITSEDEKKKLAVVRSSWTPLREKGAGRPTKKDRRAIDRLNDSFE